MGLEGPAISAVVSRLAEPTVNLAAFGGVVFPLALLVEAPIIMMLAASTALCRDWPSYIKLRRFMNRLGFSLTVIHIIMVATPVYFFLARDVIQAPEEIIGPARIGLLIMIPWTWSIAYRRLHQGVLIRFGHSLKVGLGTGVRLCADGIVLAVGLVLGWPGIVVATCALSAGVLIEALYVHLTVQPTLKYELKPSPPAPVPLTTRAMLDFYIPLSLTQLFLLIATPLASAAMSRMPMAIESLAAWPVVAGVMFITRGFGGAYNEVVVTYVERPRTTSPLRRFALVLVVVSSASLLVLAIPPVAEAVFAGLLNLSEPLPAHGVDKPLSHAAHACPGRDPELLPGSRPLQPTDAQYHGIGVDLPGRGDRRPRDRSDLGRHHRTLRRRRGLDGRRVAAHALALVAQRPGT